MAEEGERHPRYCSRQMAWSIRCLYVYESACWRVVVGRASWRNGGQAATTNDVSMTDYGRRFPWRALASSTRMYNEPSSH